MVALQEEKTIDLETIRDVASWYMNRADSVIKEFQTQVSGGSIRHALVFKGENVLQASYEYQDFEPIVTYTSREDSTLEELLEYIRDYARQYERDLLFRDEWRHNSTNVISNVENMARARSKQTFIKFWKKLNGASGLEFM